VKFQGLVIVEPISNLCSGNCYESGSCGHLCWWLADNNYASENNLFKLIHTLKADGYLNNPVWVHTHTRLR